MILHGVSPCVVVCQHHVRNETIQNVLPRLLVIELTLPQYMPWCTFHFSLNPPPCVLRLFLLIRLPPGFGFITNGIAIDIGNQQTHLCLTNLGFLPSRVLQLCPSFPFTLNLPFEFEGSPGSSTSTVLSSAPMSDVVPRSCYSSSLSAAKAEESVKCLIGSLSLGCSFSLHDRQNMDDHNERRTPTGLRSLPVFLTRALSPLQGLWWNQASGPRLVLTQKPSQPLLGSSRRTASIHHAASCVPVFSGLQRKKFLYIPTSHRITPSFGF